MWWFDKIKKEYLKFLSLSYFYNRGLIVKILVVSQNYYPEQFRINDICSELVKRGHDVTVLTGLPNYPQGKLFDGYENKEKRNEIINGVKVIRTYERERKSGGAINLFLNYYSFVFSSKKAVKKLDKDFDLVLVNQLSPVMQAYAALKYKKKFKVPVILYCLDLWPASLSAGGVSGGPIYKYFKNVSKKIYISCDKLAVTSKNFKEYLSEEFGVLSEEIEYLPQYAEDIFKPNFERKESDICNLVFAGNIGKLQGVDNIVETAKLLQDKPIKFHILGNGSEYKHCLELAEGLKNIEFYGQRDLSEMPKFYDLADAMLVTLKHDELISKTLPGKVQTCMAAGKPIIAAGENELKTVVEEAECGFVAEPDSPEALKNCILKFLDYKNKDELARNSRKYYEQNFTKELFFNKLEKLFNEVKK